jgi:hypothetical protein
MPAAGDRVSLGSTAVQRISNVTVAGLGTCRTVGLDQRPACAPFSSEPAATAAVRMDSASESPTSASASPNR